MRQGSSAGEVGKTGFRAYSCTVGVAFNAPCNTNELILKQMIVPSASKDNGDVSRFPIPIEYWPTWFTALTSEMTGDCREDSSSSIDAEAEINATVDVSEPKCECKAHKLFLEAKELEESGHENEALELLRQ